MGISLNNDTRITFLETEVKHSPGINRYSKFKEKLNLVKE